MEKTDKLSNLQLELLKVFHHDLPEAQLLEIRQLLTSYFAKRATEAMDTVWKEKQWNAEEMEKIVNEHLRTALNP